MFNNILVAVDGSEHALQAARTASQLARAMHSTTLRIVVVYDPIPSWLGEPNFQSAISARLDESHDLLRKATEAIGDVPADIQSEILEGNPAEAIIEVAKTHPTELIVMGSRGLGQLAGLVLGSTSQKVVSHAPCPVLIVR
jgi:nucleotide-binding universal stress UspA family protein